MSLTGEIERILGESGCNDYDQRSALGMARTWAEKRKPIRRVQYAEMAVSSKRDDLAGKIVGALDGSGASFSEMRRALGEARDGVNRPFYDPTMNGAKVAATIEKPKEKKAKKEK